MIADIAAVHEIGFEQRIHDLALNLFNPGPVDQAVCVQRVGRLLNGIEVHLKSDFFRVFHDRRVGAHRTLFAAELGFKVFAPVHAMSGHVRVQLKGMPSDGERVVRALFKRAIEVRLADVTPRANRV